MTIKIATWNVNSVNARLLNILSWLEAEKPDIVLLQELKCLKESFPYQELEDLGYNIAVSGQKTYNGVAILSKFPLSDIVCNFPHNPVMDEARYIEAIASINGFAVKIASVYVINGQNIDSPKYALKLAFLNALTDYYQTLIKNEELIVIGGDFNIALTGLDVYDSSMLQETILFSSIEKQQLRKFISIGLLDSYRMLNPEEPGFTWWDYRARAFAHNHGMRIDYLFCSSAMAQRNVSCAIAKEWRDKEKASDHAALVSIFSLS